jgi:hypothetical protein
MIFIAKIVKYIGGLFCKISNSHQVLYWFYNTDFTVTEIFNLGKNLTF